LRLPDTVTGLAFALLGIAAVLVARGFPAPGGQAVGPALFPTIVGTIMAAAGLIVAGRALFDRNRRALRIEDWMRRPGTLVAIAIVPAGIATYALLAPLVGTIVVGAAVVFAMALAWRERVGAALLAGAVASVALYAFFVMALRVPLPAGPIELWFQ